jgi:hypothetical protein
MSDKELIAELLAALRDLRDAATDAYKSGRVDALAFVTAGNVIANAAQQTGCRVCRTKAIGLPTPGYIHDPGCPAESRLLQRCPTCRWAVKLHCADPWHDAAIRKAEQHGGE